MSVVATPPIDRLMARVVRTPGPLSTQCWVPTYKPGPKGYVRMSIPGPAAVLAHRVSYEAFVGPAPDGLDLDHLCRNRASCNPRHLEPVTRQINLLRSPLVGRRHAAKTHCVNGHERTPENTYTKKDGRRQCRVCARGWSAGTRERQRAA